TAAGHRATKVSHLVWPDCPLVALALEEGRKGHQRHLVHADAVDPAVSRLSGDSDLGEASLAEQPLGEAFEGIGREAQHAPDQIRPPIGLQDATRLLWFGYLLLSSPSCQLLAPLTVALD